MNSIVSAVTTSESMDSTTKLVDVTSESVDDMSGRDLIGPIIGGILGGLCMLLILVLLAVTIIFVMILNHRKSKDKPTMSHTRQGMPTDLVAAQLHAHVG